MQPRQHIRGDPTAKGRTCQENLGFCRRPKLHAEAIALLLVELGGIRDLTCYK